MNERGAEGWEVITAEAGDYGYTTFWINRGGGILDRLGLEPDLEVADLAALADALGA